MRVLLVVCAALRPRFVPLLATILEQGALEAKFHLDNPQLVARIVWELGEAMEEALTRPTSGSRRVIASN